jgi:putative ABC transport system ATP-binding protein
MSIAAQSSPKSDTKTLSCCERTGLQSPGNFLHDHRAVVCDGLTHSFPTAGGAIRAVDQVNLEILLGELTLITGPSGCGKTTLLSIIAGLLRPSEGSIFVLGQDVRGLSHRALSQFRLTSIGFIFQQFNLLSGLSIVENAAIPLIARGVAGGEARRRSAALLSQLGLEKQLGSFPRQLSGGQQQRVAIARALVHEPRLVLCDEPTASLDLKRGQAVMEMLESPGQPLFVGLSKSGVVAKVFARPSMVVCKGDRLVQLDCAPFLAECDFKQAELDLAVRRLERLRSLPRPESVEIATQKLAVAKAVQVTAIEQRSRYE